MPNIVLIETIISWFLTSTIAFLIIRFFSKTPKRRTILYITAFTAISLIALTVAWDFIGEQLSLQAIKMNN